VSNKRLRIPQGTEAFFLGEAYRHRQLLRRFEDICSTWGYLPVQTPVFDFQDLYAELSDLGSDASYRLVDRDGDVLVLRSDITLFLARQMGMIVEQSDLPVRVYYGDTILRHEDPNDLSKNEFFQIGAELIGTSGLEADAEVILLLLEAAEGLGSAESILHVGSRRLVQLVNPSEAFVRAVADRNWPAARELIAGSGAAEDRVRSVVDLLGFIGSADELESLLTGLTHIAPEEEAEITSLVSLIQTVTTVTSPERVRIDLSEIGDQPYYSGMVFHLYEPDADAPVASGGRYDDLLRRFGNAAPAAGFSIMLRRLQRRLPGRALPSIPTIETVAEGTFSERVARAQTLRRSGKVARL
jgi:ATP phosphoribosyltransferase regulatory subunit